MSNRNIADLFGDSAVRQNENADDNSNNNETLEKHNDNNNVNVIENITVANNKPPKDPSPEDTKQDDILDFLKVEQEKKVVGFHLDKDVRQVFQKVLGKKPQRGAQSELANRIFRDFFEKRGLL